MDQIFYASSKALYLVIAISIIPVGVATIVGLTVALIQAVTHLQEQTLPFGLKLLAVCFCLYLCSGWMGGRVLRFGEEILQMAFQ
jgi:type III secretion HrpO family protein